MSTKVHTFSSTGRAYDACQGDEIKNGDILLIPSEKVVGLAWTWPVAVTVEYGALHIPKREEDEDEITTHQNLVRAAGWSEESIVNALALARSNGWEVRGFFTEGWR